ncbi:MAG: hypothetical protein ACE5E3_05995 [Mariprofundus sp.]
MTEQTLGTFYMGCDTSHRELYSIIIHEWQQAGLDWVWADGAVALCSHSVSKGEALRFFYLQQGESIYPASIRLDTDFWRETVGQEETDTFLRKIKVIHGLTCRQREQMFSIEDPGHVSGATQPIGCRI